MLLATAVNALYVLLIQVVALLSLDAESFGQFSLQYLVFALASSISLSFVSEAWIRTDLYGAGRSSWASYSAVSVYLAAAAAVVAAAVGFVVEGTPAPALIGGTAVGAAVYRGSARFFFTRENSPVIVGDAIGVVFILAGWLAAALTGTLSLLAVTAIWAIGAIGSSLFSRPPRLIRPRIIPLWYRRHRASIVPLLRDSVLMDAGAVGTPYIMLPMLGVAQFGIYRAVSNLSAPARLLLTPLRPVLMSTPIARQRRASWLGAVVGTSVLIGAAAFLLLAVADAVDLFGVVGDLAAYAVPVAIYVAFNSIGSYYMIVARGHLAPRPLFLGRAFHTTVAIALPIAGTLLGGLEGAIWGYTMCTALWATGWSVLVLSRRGA